jgi:hypothetical protein
MRSRRQPKRNRCFVPQSEVVVLLSRRNRWGIRHLRLVRDSDRLTLPEVGKLLGLSDPTIYTMARSGLLRTEPHNKILVASLREVRRCAAARGLRLPGGRRALLFPPSRPPSPAKGVQPGR